MKGIKYLCSTPALVAALLCGSILGTGNLLFAATLCVNPGGTGGCFSTINSAVAAASPNDTVKVAAGSYAEDVVIGKALSWWAQVGG